MRSRKSKWFLANSKKVHLNVVQLIFILHLSDTETQAASFSLILPNLWHMPNQKYRNYNC